MAIHEDYWDSFGCPMLYDFLSFVYTKVFPHEIYIRVNDIY